MKITKLFDPADGFAPLTDAWAITDATLAKRGDQWWMYMAGKATNRPSIDLFSASLPEGTPLSISGWEVTASLQDATKIALLGKQEASAPWDLKGGRHCPAYVRGWDPGRCEWVERIYYAGGAENVWGPYTIGYLEWDGTEWRDQASPAFIANEEWEHGSVYEPNLIYDEGKWKLWYVAGSNQERYLVQGYAESTDGRSNWSKHKIVFPAEERVFDFCVNKRADELEAVFSRVWLGEGPPPANTGLWWCKAKTASPDISQWSKPVQILTSEDRRWFSGPWKPSLHYSETDPNVMLVFFDGTYGQYKFTLGCLEMERPG